MVSLPKASAAAVATAMLAGSLVMSTAPVQAQYKGYGRVVHGPVYHHRPHYYRPYRRHYGGAVAAGVVGGLALGALAATAARPAYAAPTYVYEEAPVCRTIIDRRINGWGETVIRRTRVCD